MKNEFNFILSNSHGRFGHAALALVMQEFPQAVRDMLVGAETFDRVHARRRTGAIEGAESQFRVIMTNSDFRNVLFEQFQEVRIDPGAAMIEPMAAKPRRRFWQRNFQGDN